MRKDPIAPWRSISTFGSSMSFSLRQALNAVKSKLPFSVRKACFKASASQSPQEFTSPRAAYTELAFCRALIEAYAAFCSLRGLRTEGPLLLFVSSCVFLGLKKGRV